MIETKQQILDKANAVLPDQGAVAVLVYAQPATGLAYSFAPNLTPEQCSQIIGTVYENGGKMTTGIEARAESLAWLTLPTLLLILLVVIANLIVSLT